MMVGVLIASNIKINIALAPVVNGAEINIQGILDNVMPVCSALFSGGVAIRLCRRA